jgi:hypothetical protein
MDNKMKAALIGGIVAGVLCIIPLVGNCCFIWGIGGGFLAVFLYLRSVPGPMTPGEGAKLGLRAGIIGAIIYLIIAVPLTLIWGGLSMASSSSENGGALGAGLAAGLGAFIVVVVAAVLIGFMILGGLIGAAVLGKGGAAAPPPPPPPPPPAAGGFGGPTV